jgi:hypothetical protein
MADAAARVLIVDDNKVNRLLLSRNVQMQGHRAALAENGRVALEMLRREPFDLLLVDVQEEAVLAIELHPAAHANACADRHRWKCADDRDDVHPGSNIVSQALTNHWHRARIPSSAAGPSRRSSSVSARVSVESPSHSLGTSSSGAGLAASPTAVT